MRMKRKCLWIAVLFLLGALSLTACGERRAELDKPSNVVLDDQEVLTWSAVKNAVKYEVDVNGVSYWTEAESLDLFERIVQPGAYQIRVCAYGGKGELPSDWSEAVPYTLNSLQGLVGFAEVDGGYTITAMKPLEITGKLVIPEALGGVPVVRIYQSGFSGCANMTGLILPNTVTKIGGRAFKDCTSLKRVKLSDAVESMDNNEFAGCSALTRVEIPEGVMTLGSAFTACTLLRSVSLPSTLVSISAGSFTDCQNMAELTVAKGNPVFYSEQNCVIRKADRALVLGGKESVIPHDVEVIENGAFRGRAALEKLEIPSGVTRIEDYAFLGTGLTELELPESVAEIGKCAFVGCNSLMELSVAEGNPVYRSAGNCILRRADNELVVGCPASVIPEEITAVGPYAFLNVKTLKEVVLPEGVKKIGESAFAACAGLETVYLPSGLQSIGDGAFYACRLLSTIYLPNGLQSIGKEAFYDCWLLTTVVLPDSVETIGKNAFRDGTVYTSYAIGAEPEGWYRYEPWDCGWGVGSVVFYGSTISYDGAYPYVSAYGELFGPEYVDFGMIGIGTAYDHPWIPKRAGYTFVGWATEEGSHEVVYGITMAPLVAYVDSGDSWKSLSGGNAIELGDFPASLTFKERTKIPDGTVLYAVWEPQN